MYLDVKHLQSVADTLSATAFLKITNFKIYIMGKQKYLDRNDKSFLIGDDKFLIFQGNKYFWVRVFLPFVSSVFKCDKKEPLQNIIMYFKNYTEEETLRQEKLIAESKQK